MTVEERLKMIIGDLVISRCALETRIEELEAKLKEAKAEQEQPSMFTSRPLHGDVDRNKQAAE
jgi:hypothetical protein